MLQRVSPGSGLFNWPLWPWKKVSLYNDIASMLNGGISLTEAIQTMAETQRGSTAALFADLLERVEAGQGLGQAMAEHPERISPAEATLIDTSEQTGNLPDALASLAQLNQFKVDLLKKNMFMVVYPVILYLASLFILNLPLLFSGKSHHYFVLVGTGLLILFLLAGAGLFAVTFVPLRRVLPWLRAIWWHIPFASIPLKHLGLTMYCKGMAAGIDAGFGIDKTLEIAAKLSSMPGIDAVNQRIRERIGRGDDLFSALSASRLFSISEMSSIKAGEKAGTLEQVFQKLATTHMARFSSTAKVLMWVVAAGIFAVIMGIVAYRVFQGLEHATIGNLNQINNEIMNQNKAIHYIK